MYKVLRLNHEKYGKVIEILRSETGEEDPFFAVEKAKTKKRLWNERGAKNVRFLVDNQILTQRELDKWYREEYKSLPKCGWCAKILGEQIHTNALPSGDLYCSRGCADFHYHQRMDYLNDYEEWDI